MGGLEDMPKSSAGKSHRIYSILVKCTHIFLHSCQLIFVLVSYITVLKKYHLGLSSTKYPIFPFMGTIFY